MTLRSWTFVVVLAFAATLISTVVRRSVRVTYSDIMGCEVGCEVTAVGFPFPFIIDYPGLSPVSSADLAGALLGLDKVHWARAAGTFAVWLGVLGAVQYFGRRRGGPSTLRARTP